MSIFEEALFLDCQTTGMRPSTGRILEIAWSGASGQPVTRCVKLPEGESIPERIRRITGLEDDDLSGGRTEAEILTEWQDAVRALGPNPHVVVHYAQFEKAFLLDCYRRQGLMDLGFEMLCSQRIAKRLFPELPSQNLRGMAGFFGLPVGELKRAPAHVSATVAVWRAIAARLAEIGVGDWAALKLWLQESPRKKTSPRYEYRLEREKRLSLPDQPGIYRMLGKAGEVLYVGKATSLRSRVNSYFRGQKGRDRRKLELMAQVWDLRVTECGSTLEAELLEADEIKRWNPAYNVSLRGDRGPLLFYSRDFMDSARDQDERFCIGPFRPGGVLDSLRRMRDWLATGELHDIFYQEIEGELLTAGFAQFCAKHGYAPELFTGCSMRRLVGFGMKHLRTFYRLHPKQDLETVLARQKAAEIKTDKMDASEVAGKFDRLLLRSAAALRRARTMTDLLNSDISIQGRIVQIRNGATGRWPWRGADIAVYDRMSILLSGLIRGDATVVARRVENRP